MGQLLRRTSNFLRHNQHKKLTLVVWLFTAYYRILLLFVASEKLHKYWGNAGEESPWKESPESYSYARYVARDVERVSGNTPWQSKCLVKALATRRLLCRKGISNTLYLGVGKDEDDKMIAHAWLRCGKMYVTGGNGTGYAVVAKFAS